MRAAACVITARLTVQHLQRVRPSVHWSPSLLSFLPHPLRYADAEIKLPVCREFSSVHLSGGVAQLVRASHRHVADAGSIPRCGKGFFSHNQLSVQTLLRVSVHHRVQSLALTSVCTLKIPWSMSEFGGLWKHSNIKHAP